MTERPGPARSRPSGVLLLLLAYALFAVCWTYQAPRWSSNDFNILAILLITLATVLAAVARPSASPAFPALPEALLGFLVAQRIFQQLSRALWSSVGGLAWAPVGSFTYYHGFHQVSQFDAEQILLFLVFVNLAWKGTKPAAAAAIFVAGAMAVQGMYYVIALHPQPHMDVWYMLKGGAQRLMAGGNPYTGVYRMPWLPPVHKEVGLQWPWFPYWPGTLIPCIVGLLGLDDVRWGTAWSTLAAGGCAALLVLTCGAGVERRRARRLAALAAAVFVLAPEVVSMWAWAWTEPFLVGLCAGFALAWRNGRRGLAGVLFGLLIASKQHAVVFLLPALMMTRDRRFWIAAGLTALAVLLPFIAANPREFYTDTVWFPLSLPWRPEGLTLDDLCSRFGFHLPGFVAPVALLTALWVMLRRRPFGLPECLQWCGVLLSLAFLFAKCAYRNYFHLVGALWVLALLAAWLESQDGETADERG
ncbi:MAG: DUF2029 domain-containing protein [Armatimonadetes bacterium]|nr:DUF2029 domain-containing protein [Armatimonadota bacterium]